MSDVTGLIEVRFERQHGVHQFVTADGMPVTGISEPTWEAFKATLDDLPTTDGYIISPELITSPVPLEDIAAMRPEIEERAAWVQEQSMCHPWARLLLGTATFDDEDEKPFNSVVAYMGGREIGRQHKMGATWGENEHLRVGRNLAGVEALSVPHRMLLCADLIQAAAYGGLVVEDKYKLGPHVLRTYHDLIPAASRTVIASSCWGVPPHENMDTERLETKCFDMLKRSVEGILNTYPGVEEVIMIDRAIPKLGLEPFNAHFQRVATT